MAKASGKIYIGIGGHVVALDTATGEEVWRQKIRTSSYVTIRPEAKVVYAGAGGHIFCLDAASGAIRWSNPLPRLGNGVIDFGMGSMAMMAAIADSEASAAAAAAAG